MKVFCTIHSLFSQLFPSKPGLHLRQKKFYELRAESSNVLPNTARVLNRETWAKTMNKNKLKNFSYSVFINLRSVFLQEFGTKYAAPCLLPEMTSLHPITFPFKGIAHLSDT